MRRSRTRAMTTNLWSEKELTTRNTGLPYSRTPCAGSGATTHADDIHWQCQRPQSSNCQRDSEQRLRVECGDLSPLWFGAERRWTARTNTDRLSPPTALPAQMIAATSPRTP